MKRSNRELLKTNKMLTVTRKVFHLTKEIEYVTLLFMMKIWIGPQITNKEIANKP